MLVSLKLDEIEVGKNYLAYSSKSRHLNDHQGVVVEVLETLGDNVKVRIAKNGFVMTIRNLSTRKDAYLLSLIGLRAKLVGKVTAEGLGFTEKMQGEIVTLDDYLHMQDSSYLTGTNEVGAIRIIEHAWVRGEGNDIVLYADKEEEERKALEALRKEAEELLAKKAKEGIRLGKGLEYGQLGLFKWAHSVRKLILKDFNDRAYRGVSSFTMVFLPEKEKDFAIVEPNRAILQNSFGHPCHWEMKNPEFDGKCPLVWTMHKKTEGHKERDLLWIDYIVNRSGFSRMFLTKDPEDIYENGYLVDTRFPYNFVYAGTSCTRQLWEYPIKGYAFEQLLSKGTNEHFAWYAAQFASGKEDKLRLDANASHTFVNQDCLGNKALLNFLTGVTEDSKFYFDKPTYKNSDQQWGETGDNTFNEGLRANCGSKSNKGFGKAEYKSLEELALSVQKVGLEWSKRMGFDYNGVY